MQLYRTSASPNAGKLTGPVRALSCLMGLGGNSSDGAARSGILSLRHGTLQLPGALIYTRRGGALNLTPDILNTLQPAAEHIYADASQLITAPAPETANKHPQGMRGFLAWDNKVVVAAARDPLLSLFSKWETGTDKGLKVDLVSGCVLVTLDRHMDLINALQPDMYAALGDEVLPTATDRRIRDSVERTLRWLDATLAEHAKRKLSCPPPMAAIQGALDLQQRLRSALESAKRAVSGFTLSGFGAGEPAQARQAILPAIISHLPEHLPRFMPGAFSPAEVVHAVASGVDLFDTSFAVRAADAGHALSLFADPEAAAVPEQLPGSAQPEQAAVQPQGGRPSKRVRHGSSGKAKAMKLAPAPAASPAAIDLDSSGAEPQQTATDGVSAAAVNAPSDLHGRQQGAQGNREGGASSCGQAGELPANGIAAQGLDALFGAADAASQQQQQRQDTQLPGSSPDEASQASKAAAAPYEGGRMNLWSPAYRLDKRPFVEGCTCMACRQHTRAYVHHLLNTEEMLAKVLLEVHNTHEYLQLFAKLQAAIAHGELAALQAAASQWNI